MRTRNNSSQSLPARVLITLLPLLLLAGCSANRRPGSPAIPGLDRPIEKGVASWYGPGFHGRRTANGEKYDMYAMTAAHPRLPFGTRLQVRNIRTGQSAVVRINDRGPFKKKRIIDLSYAAARELGVYGPGTALVELYPAPPEVRTASLADLPAADALQPPPPISRYTVQVGAFSDADRAVALHRQISTVFPEVFVHSDGTWNRVQVGLFRDRDQAESLRRELAVLGLSSVVVATR